MPLVHVTSDGQGLSLHAGQPAVIPTLAMALRRSAGPVVIMLHGYKYRPGHPGHCPHGTLFSIDANRDRTRAMSWPRALAQDSALAIGFGWNARGSIWQAWDNAAKAAEQLAWLIDTIAGLAPHRPANVIAHSLGARVLTQALPRLARPTVDRAVLLAAAEYGHNIAAALDSPAGSRVRLLNVTSRENDLFDFLFERFIPPPRSGARAAGHGFDMPRTVTLQIDCQRTLASLAANGFPVGNRVQRICHWSVYLREGLFPLYRAFLRQELAFEQLRSLASGPTAPRWSRLLPRPMPAGPWNAGLNAP